MVSPAFRRSLRLAPLVGAILLLAACASSGGAKPKPTPEANQLYTQLDQASRGYENAVAQTRAGNTQAAQQTLDASLDQLKSAAAHCPNTPGCDPQRFFSVFDRLLRLKDGNFSLGDDLGAMGDEVPEGSESGKTGAASLPEAQRSVTLLRGQQLSQLIAMNGPVKAALEMWLTQWRGNLMDAYINYQFLRYQMWPEYQKADLPEALLFGILAKESGGKVHAISRSGAAGPLQFMYATGLRFGLTTEDGF
ncbi:MAG: lytic transglycosylase domain-containing protein, partial [Dyella sp.]|nr:lytic transglycosylase domain-containing protein [Dyella sp.]